MDSLQGVGCASLRKDQCICVFSFYPPVRKVGHLRLVGQIFAVPPSVGAGKPVQVVVGVVAVEPVAQPVGEHPRRVAYSRDVAHMVVVIDDVLHELARAGPGGCVAFQPFQPLQDVVGVLRPGAVAVEHGVPQLETVVADAVQIFVRHPVLHARNAVQHPAEVVAVAHHLPVGVDHALQTVV